MSTIVALDLHIKLHKIIFQCNTVNLTPLDFVNGIRFPVFGQIMSVAPFPIVMDSDGGGLLVHGSDWRECMGSMFLVAHKNNGGRFLIELRRWFSSTGRWWWLVSDGLLCTSESVSATEGSKLKLQSRKSCSTSPASQHLPPFVIVFPYKVQSGKWCRCFGQTERYVQFGRVIVKCVMLVFVVG